MSQNSSNGKVLSNSLIYTISGLLVKCFNFFLIPLYTAHLTTQDYGLTSISSSFLSVMGCLASFTLTNAVMRFYVDYKEDSVKLKRFYGTVSIFVLLSGIIFGALIFWFREIFSQRVFSGSPFYPVILINVVTVVFYCQHQIYDTILRSQQKAVKCSILSILYFVVAFLCNLYFVVRCNYGAVGVLLSSLIASLLYTAYFWIDTLMTKKIVICLDKKILADALSYSVPLVPHGLSSQIAELVSKVFISSASSLGDVGVFSVASQFGTVSDTVQVYVNNAFSPWLFEKLHEKADYYRETIRKTTCLLCAFTGLFFVSIALFSQDYILLFVNKSFMQAWQYVPLVVGVYSIKTAYWFYVNVLFYNKKASRILFIATVSSSLLNLVLSAVLIPKYSVYGSILADALAMSVRVVIVVIISNRFEKIGYRLLDFVNYLFFTCLFIAIGLAPTYLSGIQVFSISNFLYKVVVVVLYCVISFVRNREYIVPFLGIIKTSLFKKRS